MGTARKLESRLKRKRRVRKRIRGTSERPRLCIFRSNKHIYAQIIDDSTGNTLIQASSVSKGLDPEVMKNGGNRKGAGWVGTAISERATQMGIKRVVFDRNGFLYHGRVKAVSDAARAGGLEF